MARKVPRLPRQVIRLCRQGKIPKRFRVADVRKQLEGFSENYIRTALANYAVNGNYVQHWSEPRFMRVAPGLYELHLEKPH